MTPTEIADVRRSLALVAPMADQAGILFYWRLFTIVQLGVTTSSTAKLFAAYLSRDVTESLVKSELAKRGMHTSEQVERVYSEYVRIRARGIANSLGARRCGLNALSVPIFAADGQGVVAVTALGMAPRFDAEMTATVATRMLALSEELSVQMGFPVRRKWYLHRSHIRQMTRRRWARNSCASQAAVHLTCCCNRGWK